jgi:phosphoglycerol geranylgeranyltransferase
MRQESSNNHFLKELSRPNQIAVLVDPEKFDINNADEFFNKIKFSGVNYLFIGGSTVSRDQFKSVCTFLKSKVEIPLIGFPGDVYQYDDSLDALLYLSLLSGRNADYLIAQHLKTSKEISEANFETISTAYLLIDGGINSATAYVSQTQAIPQSQLEIIERTAIAGKLQGKQILYLDAGSGAINPVDETIIETCHQLGLPLIIGGGIRSTEQIQKMHQAGASVVVIGNHIEDNLDFLLDLQEYTQAKS